MLLLAPAGRTQATAPYSQYQQRQQKLHNMKGSYAQHADGDAIISMVFDAAARLLLEEQSQTPMGLDGRPRRGNAAPAAGFLAASGAAVRASLLSNYSARLFFRCAGRCQRLAAQPPAAARRPCALLQVARRRRRWRRKVAPAALRLGRGAPRCVRQRLIV